ncbi:MAG: thioredoxin family protein [Candidatus Aminicenantes bacterium]|nr:thioredoxin family protein [Candidatus Aminicenantes bacterium]
MSRLCSPHEIREITGSGDGVFVLFYASWCPFSLAFLPVYEKHAEGGDAEFVRILLDGNEALFNEHGVDVYPTVVFFKNGAVARRLDGKPLAGLEEKQLAELVSSCLTDRE